ncbi:DNA polymerase III subunit gamma and tau [Longimycelium tulufanense]|uniref:DNA polymerase III subunit gamma/tau n=1 Tax=Longimycelium tulufanense TaxID=907463 RepID=A0A8J3CJR4_9PSEU|nr:DNA polymerase III subunit gamma and tau [Longimycelium tulufanense]GGM77735.1 DNA polymerase III subunit gamma and tau [Longimycelium tulufanense]
MALALYRKYRPATFAELVGQEHVTEPLRTALSTRRINHAYLFSGPRGCGKTSSARILARSLNCEQGPTPDPCGQCASCVALAPEGPGNVDVVELDAASHGGVDDARELRDRAFYAPAESRYRVFIIDEAHMVTPQGFNALLKIVEEPPEHLIFVFATTEPDKVLTTIRSRTHHYPFRLMPPGVMRELVERICAEEGVTVEPAVFPLVIRAGGGSGRDTLSVLDQLLAGAGPEGVTYQRAMALLGVTDVALIDDMVDALAAHDGAAVFGAVNNLVEAGHDPRRFASDLLDRMRDLVLLRAVPDAADRGLIDVPGDQLERMSAQARNIGPATLTRYAEILHTGLTEMRGATAPRLLLELMCARMLLPGATDDESSLHQRVEALERRGPAGPAVAAGGGSTEATADGPRRFERTSQRPGESPAPAAPTRTPAQAPHQEPASATPPPPAEPKRAEPPAPSRPQPPEPPREPTPPTPAAAGAPAAGGPDAATIRRDWPRVLDEVGKVNKITRALLAHASVQGVDGNTVVVAMPTAQLARQLEQGQRLEVLRGALCQALGGDWNVQCVHGDGPGTPPAAGNGGGRPTAPARQAPQRSAQPARQAPERREPPRRTTPSGPPVDDVPPPPEPPEDIPPPPDLGPEPEPAGAAEPMDDAAMRAEADRLADESTATGPAAPRHDPEEAAISLLREHLGAHKIE